MENEKKARTAAGGAPVQAVVIPAFGSIVKFSQVYKRWSRRPNDGVLGARRLKVWERTPTDDIGIFLGTRTLKNGISEWYDDEGYNFYPREHFEAALVCPGPRRAPVLVPLDALESV